jgi:hypothetical protein
MPAGVKALEGDSLRSTLLLPEQAARAEAEALGTFLYDLAASSPGNPPKSDGAEVNNFASRESPLKNGGF